MHTMIEFEVPEFLSIKKYPEKIYYKGNLDLLNRQKVSIIGSRKPNQYTQQMTHHLASELSRIGICIVSGGAMGVDAIAHRGAGSDSTIVVLPCGIDLHYPAVNKSLLENIENNGLSMSQFELSFQATNWSFVVRNSLVVALGEVLIVTQADINSGSMRSVEFALEMGKKIYVLPHRIGDSEGTNRLLSDGKAEPIYDIDTFVGKFGMVHSKIDKNDPFVLFCATQPVYEEAVVKFGDRVFEAELAGIIEVKNGRINVV
ncbi:DNA-processing protein DprA [Sulfuricurvum sp.]|uniref:DNA-processing protein DprA n=1 Tax=Sulfuricurvum sp. TaxID=2025608 RepID=UPI003BB70FB6